MECKRLWLNKNSSGLILKVLLLENVKNQVTCGTENARTRSFKEGQKLKSWSIRQIDRKNAPTHILYDMTTLWCSESIH